MMRRAIAFLPWMIVSCTCALLAQTNYDTSPKAQSGVQVFGSYFGTDIDSVALYNGNLNLRIELIDLPGRELSMGVAYSYNTQKWEQQTCDDGFGNFWTCGLYTGGWRLQTPFGSGLSLFWSGCDVNAYWFDAVGTKHRYLLKNAPQANCNGQNAEGLTLPTTDSDGSILYAGDSFDPNNPVAPYVSFKDGSILHLRTGYYETMELVTVHGNKLSRANSSTSPLPSQDTLGRTIQYSNNTYTVSDSNGISRNYTVTWTTITPWDPWWGTTSGSRWVIQAITLPNGKSYQFEYNHVQGFLTKVTLPSGAYIRYVYPAAPNNTNAAYDQVLQRIVSADGSTENTWTYSGYSGLGTTSSARTVTVTSPEGDKVVHTFNAQGEETQTQWRTSTNTTLKTVNVSWSQDAIESNGQPNNPKIQTTTTILDSNLQSQRNITYDAKMNVTQEKVTDWGYGAPGPVILQHDKEYQTWTGTNLWRLKTDTVTAINPVTGTFVQQGKTEYVFDQYGQTVQSSPTVQIPALLVRSGVPGHDGRTTGYGNVTTIKRYKDATNFVPEYMAYDNLGNVVKTINALNHVTTIDFADNFTEASKNGSKWAYAKKITNPLGQYTTTKYDFNTGLPKELTNFRGFTTTTAYDLLNRVTSVTEPNGKLTTYAYDDTNRITTKEVTVDDAGNKGHVETYFDGLYRVTQTRTNDPDPAGPIYVETEYDGKGRTKRVTNPRRSGEAQLWTTTAYDALDRPIQVLAPDGSTVQYAYSNNQTSVTDEAGNQRQYTYNNLGQMTRVEEPNPTLSTPLISTYKYYGLGPLHQSNQLRTFVYNWVGQMTSHALPESGTTTFVYDAIGRLTSKTDARNITTTFTYDNAGRPTGKTHSDGTPAVSWGYDANGYTALKTSMTDAVGSVSFQYDTMNRLTQESRTLTGVTGAFSTSYGYNIKGDLTSMTYPSGRVVNFNYATGGGCCNSRLASVVDQTTSTTVAGTTNYNAAGELLNSTLGNNVVQTFGYNDRFQQTSISAALSGTTLMHFTYNYGMSTTNTGRVLSRTDSIQPEHSTKYTYDSIYRLSHVASNDASTSWGLGWTFDTWGNRLTQSPLGLASGKVGGQTSGYTNNRNTSNTYDAAGNQTNDGLHTYTFNAENQITQMDGGAAVYAYDGEGRRMKKTVGSETTYYFYGPGGLLCEFSTSNTISSATAAASTDKTLYRTSDRLGSAVLVINAAGLIIENNRTLPYGEAWLAENMPSTNDKKFTTYQRDQESGLDYAMNRYDSFSQGRFMSPDPAFARLAVPASLNRYSYSLNDPINLTDPDGRWHGGGFTPEPPFPFHPCDVWDRPLNCTLLLLNLIRSRLVREPQVDVSRELRATRAASQLMDFGTINGWDFVDSNHVAIYMTDELLEELSGLDAINSLMCGPACVAVQRLPGLNEKIAVISVALLEALRHLMARQPAWDVTCGVAPVEQQGDHHTIGQVGPVRVRAPSATAAIKAAKFQLTAQMLARFGPDHRLIHCNATLIPNK